MNKTEEAADSDEITVTVPRREGLVFQLEHLQGTSVWVVVQLGDLDEILTKAKLWDNHELQVAIGDRVCYIKHYGEERRML
jgi:hypothetical protein